MSVFLSIYIRENSIEYNQPTLQPAQSNTVLTTCLCCGHSPTALTVRDHITTIHFDDMILDGIRNDTRPCNPLQTFCCGGRGEEVRLESRFCGEMCYRGRSVGAENCGLLNSCCCCVPCVPVGCPECLCPCAARVSRPCEDRRCTLFSNIGNRTKLGHRKLFTSKTRKQQFASSGKPGRCGCGLRTSKQFTNFRRTSRDDARIRMEVMER